MKYIVTFEVLTAVLFGVLGCLCLFWPVVQAEAVFYGTAVLCTLSAAALIIRCFRGERKGSDIAAAIICTIVSIIFWDHQRTGSDLIVVLFALYMFGSFFSEAVQTVLDFRDQCEARRIWSHIAYGLFYLVLCILAVAYRHQDIRLIVRLMGAYLLMQALQLLIEMLWFSRPKSSRSYQFSHWIALPAFIVGVLPAVVLRWMLSKKMVKARHTYDQHKNDEPVNLRVFIHTGLSGDHLFGHMTFSYRGIMYSYGNYDKREEHFFRSIGPGVFFTVPADIYVNNSCIYEGSTIFEFGLHLNEEQEHNLQQLLRQIFSETYRWYCPIEKDDEGRLHFKRLEEDYSCRLSYRTGAKFRKFYHGQWKTYWILGGNCSLFADDVLSRIGCQIVRKSGIVSPGEYFEFFEEEYQDPSSNVVYKSWHDPSEPWTLFDTLA